MTSFRSTYFIARELIGVAIIATVVVGAGRLVAEEPLPSQEQALNSAVEHHADIVAAKAKVALAESELNSKRMEVSRQIIGMYGAIKDLEAQLMRSKAVLSTARFELESNQDVLHKTPGAISAIALQRSKSVMQEKEAELVQVLAKRAQIEKELRLQIGSAPAMTSGKDSKSPRPLQTPRGPMADKIHDALDRSVKLNFGDAPLSRVADYLSDATGVRVTLHGPGLAEGGIPADHPLSVQTNEVSVRAALQAIEDALETAEFVVREYGIILTTKEYAKNHGLVPAVEFSR